MNDERPYTAKDFARTILVMIQILGWLFFLAMLYVKLSGATIYATTESMVIEQIDPVWSSLGEELLEDSDRLNKGVRFHLKIQGVQWNQPPMTAGRMNDEIDPPMNTRQEKE